MSLAAPLLPRHVGSSIFFFRRAYASIAFGNTRLRRELLLLSVMHSCLSLSEHVTSLSREKLKRCVRTLLLDSRCPLPSQFLSCFDTASLYMSTSDWVILSRTRYSARETSLNKTTTEREVDTGVQEKCSDTPFWFLP